MAAGNEISRRRFVGRVGGAAAGLAVGAAPAIVRGVGANESVVYGAIGLGSRGRRLIQVARTNPEVQVASLCDVFAARLDAGAKDVGDGVEKVIDYRRILDRKDIDVVIIATPEHQHAQPLIDAVHAGKDVYVEKPLCHTIEEGRAMIKAVRTTKRVVQVGMQQRSAPHYIEARDIIRSGRLGNIYLVTSYWYQDFRGHQTARYPVPKGLDWRRFLGSAPWRSVEKEPWRFWDWRYYWDYSGGAMCDNGTHIWDWVHMLMGDKDSPVSATCTGSKMAIKRWDTPDVFSATLNYENDWVSTLSFNYTEHYPLGHFHGSLFHGTDGLIEVNRSGFAFYPRGSKVPEQEGKNQGMDPFHTRNFLDCVKSRERPNADIAIGYQGVRSSLLANLAYREERQVRFDPRLQRVLR